MCICRASKRTASADKLPLESNAQKTPIQGLSRTGSMDIYSTISDMDTSNSKYATIATDGTVVSKPPATSDLHYASLASRGSVDYTATNLLTFSENGGSQPDLRSNPGSRPRSMNVDDSFLSSRGSGSRPRSMVVDDSEINTKAALMDFFLNDASFHSNPLVTGELKTVDALLDSPIPMEGTMLDSSMGGVPLVSQNTQQGNLLNIQELQHHGQKVLFERQRIKSENLIGGAVLNKNTVTSFPDNTFNLIQTDFDANLINTSDTQQDFNNLFLSSNSDIGLKQFDRSEQQPTPFTNGNALLSSDNFGSVLTKTHKNGSFIGDFLGAPPSIANSGVGSSNHSSSNIQANFSSRKNSPVPLIPNTSFENWAEQSVEVRPIPSSNPQPMANFQHSNWAVQSEVAVSNPSAQLLNNSDTNLFGISVDKGAAATPAHQTSSTLDTNNTERLDISARIEGVYIDMRTSLKDKVEENEYVGPGDVEKTKDKNSLDFLLLQ